jgi:hypothetical protein
LRGIDEVVSTPDSASTWFKKRAQLLTLCRSLKNNLLTDQNDPEPPGEKARKGEAHGDCGSRFKLPQFRPTSITQFREK